jgi:dCMP deaminase
MADWKQRYLDIVAAVSAWSKDDVKVGAVIYHPETHAILSVGYNGFPRGVDDRADRNERPYNKLYTVHAETNAIYNAARHGIKLDGMGLALAWYPCAPCAGAIVQAGIKEVICTTPDWDNPKWGLSHQTAHQIFYEARVREIR